jgi:enoyl-CoA hydratase/carnithine racemase
MLEIFDHAVNPDASDARRIRELRLARPPVNALNGDLLRRLVAAIDDARAAAAIAITGQPGLFSAGLDVPAMLAMDESGLAEVFTQLWHAQRAIASSPVPVVFGLTGHCPAGGTVLAIHGDYRVLALGDFRMGLNEVQVGLFPGAVIHGAFRRLVAGHAAQLLTRGALLDPTAALRVGLVDELCEPGQCAARALEVAREYAALPREPMLRTRELARRDLLALFGDPFQADSQAREFARLGVEMWLVPATRERLKSMFSRRSAAR